MRKSVYGFTLVELLVVIAIMAITGMYVLSNYGSFGQDRNLKNAALDIQSLLRQAQVNSTSGLKCQDQASSGWLVAFSTSTAMDLKCDNSSGRSNPLKTLGLPTNISVQVISGVCTPTYAKFTPLYGTMTSDCTNAITITLTNSSSGHTKSLTVEQGGRIYAQ